MLSSALKRELAVFLGLFSLLGARRRKPLTSAALVVGAVGLYLNSLKPQFTFVGKRVLITGGSRGLGLSLAWNLLKQGATVTLLARDLAELQEGRAKLLEDFPDADVWIRQCDVTQTTELAGAISSAIQDMQGLDLLINNAGAILVGPFTSMTREDFEAQMKLHLYAVLEATQLTFEHFKNQGGGRILNICSLGGKMAVPHMLPYAASKFALAGFSQGVTSELAAHGIQVTTAFPIVMRTGAPLQAVFKGDQQNEYAVFAALDNLPGLSMSSDQAAKKILRAVQDGRSEIVLSMPAKARQFLGLFFPETFAALFQLAARWMPTVQSQTRRTGAESSEIFNSSWLTGALSKRERKSEEVYNQKPRHPADFNLGTTKH